MERAHPGVYFPPPLLFVAALGLGVLLDQRWPASLGMSENVRVVAGLALAAVWVALFGWAGLRFLRARTSVLPHHAASALVTDGPYRVSRNPMYVGMVTLHLAVTLWLDNAWALALLVPALLALRYYVIRREEEHLETVFGDAYRDYRARVRRWL